MKILVSTFFFLFSLGGSLFAQDEDTLVSVKKDDLKKVPKAIVSVIAIGDSPPIRLTVHKDKADTYDEAKPEDCPPSQLFVKDPVNKGEALSLGLSLNRPARPMEYPTGRSLQLFASKDGIGAEDVTSYLKIDLPKEKVDVSVFLIRTPNKRGWVATPKSYVFKNDKLSFPPNSMRILNFSSVEAKVQIGARVLTVRPNTNEIVALERKSQGVVIYSIAVPGEKGESKLLTKNAGASYYIDSRINLVVYDSDGSDKRRKPVRFIRYLERP